MGRIRAASLVFVTLVAGLLPAACGGGGANLLPGTTADQINSNLDQVRASVEAGNCEAAESAVAAVSTEVDGLEKVDEKLKEALKEGALKLSEVVSSCNATEEAEAERATEEAATAEQEQLETEKLAEEEAFAKEQKQEEREEKAQEKAEKHAEQPGPSSRGEEANGKAKGHEKQEEAIETPSEEEAAPPSGPAGGIGPGAAVEGGGGG